jgi:hypothetical protein
VVIGDSFAARWEATALNDQRSPITNESQIKDRQVFN